MRAELMGSPLILTSYTDFYSSSMDNMRRNKLVANMNRPVIYSSAIHDYFVIRQGYSQDMYINDTTNIFCNIIRKILFRESLTFTSRSSCSILDSQLIVAVSRIRSWMAIS